MSMNTKTTLAMAAIVAALTRISRSISYRDPNFTTTAAEPAYAAGPGNPGCGNTPGLNASQGRCLHP
jgi:hypothetical protein